MKRLSRSIGCYCHVMQTPKKGQDASITTPLLQELIERATANSKIQNASLSEQPQPANLYQDVGNGYNSNFVFPQE
ncbi:MAG TPA: hypothetical protein VH351_14840 [Bryobacteraceae bacterium]|nr:hypothetical protein [Bryobacteraceae bacterium]